MSMESSLKDRAGSKCELCTSTESISAYEIPPVDEGNADKAVLLCGTCKTQVEAPTKMDANHWRCLNDSMWSEHAPVQVMAWRVFDQLVGEGWAQDLQAQMYMDEPTQAWAESMRTDPDAKPTKDSNGAQLMAGDSVTLIKDLVVKGANFTAKRGTMVRNISLTNDPKHIEGKVNGTQIVLVSAYLKKV